jgi:hypothetical protein
VRSFFIVIEDESDVYIGLVKHLMVITLALTFYLFYNKTDIFLFTLWISLFAFIFGIFAIFYLFVG